MTGYRAKVTPSSLHSSRLQPKPICQSNYYNGSQSIYNNYGHIDLSNTDQPSWYVCYYNDEKLLTFFALLFIYYLGMSLFICWFSYSFINLFNHFVIHLFINSVIHIFIYSFNQLMLQIFVYLFICRTKPEDPSRSLVSPSELFRDLCFPSWWPVVMTRAWPLFSSYSIAVLMSSLVTAAFLSRARWKLGFSS